MRFAFLYTIFLLFYSCSIHKKGKDNQEYFTPIEMPLLDEVYVQTEVPGMSDEGNKTYLNLKFSPGIIEGADSLKTIFSNTIREKIYVDNELKSRVLIKNTLFDDSSKDFWSNQLSIRVYKGKEIYMQTLNEIPIKEAIYLP